jgi:hypothetical protein
MVTLVSVMANLTATEMDQEMRGYEKDPTVTAIRRKGGGPLTF